MMVIKYIFHNPSYNAIVTFLLYYCYIGICIKKYFFVNYLASLFHSQSKPRFSSEILFSFELSVKMEFILLPILWALYAPFII